MNDKPLTLDRKFDFFTKNAAIPLAILCVGAFLVRFYLGNFELPFTFDALGYFLYAMDISINGHLPPNYSIGNNGWPIFLSGFLSLFQFNSVFQYMEIQRLLTTILSALTVIPVYLLCRRFFEKPYSLLGAAIFASEPRLILNASLGVTEPLYILLGTVTLTLFLSNNRNVMYSSFLLAAFVSMIRTEGLFLFLAISFIFFFRFRREKYVIPKYIPALLIFVLVLLPMAVYRTETMGHDGLTQRIINGFYGHVLGSSQFPEKVLDEVEGNTQGTFFERGVENFAKYLAWDLLPIFVFFVPLGVFFLLRDRNFKNVTLIATAISMSIPAFYAYSIPLQDTRYLFFLYPIFCVVSLFAVKKLADRFRGQKGIILLVFLGILVSSAVFFSFKHTDYEHQREAFLFAKILVGSEKKVNAYLPESGYIEPANIPDDFAAFESYYHQEREKGVSVRASIPQKVTVLSTGSHDSLDSFIEDLGAKGLTHIIVDENPNRPDFLKDVFVNEVKYPYLKKEFDSADHGFVYHVKIFRIDYGLMKTAK